jgi:hypothetical protein
MSTGVCVYYLRKAIFHDKCILCKAIPPESCIQCIALLIQLHHCTGKMERFLTFPVRQGLTIKTPKTFYA